MTTYKLAVKPHHDPLVKECPDCVDWLGAWAEQAQVEVERLRAECERLLCIEAVLRAALIDVGVGENCWCGSCEDDDEGDSIDGEPHSAACRKARAALAPQDVPAKFHGHGDLSPEEWKKRTPPPPGELISDGTDSPMPERKTRVARTVRFYTKPETVTVSKREWEAMTVLLSAAQRVINGQPGAAIDAAEARRAARASLADPKNEKAP